MTDKPTYFLFVYGSLRSGFQSHAYEYISRYFVLAGPAKVKGKLFDMGSYPAAVPTGDNIFITGELYHIMNPDEFSWALGQLDDYEGVSAEAGSQPLYYRSITDAYINGEIKPAWIYWYNGEVTGKPVITSGDVIEYLNQKR
ncbi:MAG TPA: gamma-glutamylcyclotransferase [Chitinophagaceae bacterium]|jgi:gamma-glutamylcyclotransferase (GGCT)/AIG2-like uncharacterized protein YtfP|nr:gamma-glutamylcyclotransferase [Chitinophagaceae bacterium]